MDTSIFLAKVLGPYCLIVATGVLLNQKSYLKMFDDILKNSAFLYLGGAFALIFGLLIVTTHNVWAAGWPVIITVVGWIGIAKGVWLIVFPATLPNTIAYYQKNPSMLTVRLVVVLVLGLILTSAGYCGKAGFCPLY